jgi:hypothetical protein
MEDSIVQQLRDRAYAFKATDRLSEQAADEIERLQLTDAERYAIERAAFVSDQAGLEKSAATLRKLLERTK